MLQLAAQVLDEFDDEDIGVGLLDAKLDKVVAKKLGKNSTEKKTQLLMLLSLFVVTQNETSQCHYLSHLSK